MQITAPPVSANDLSKIFGRAPGAAPGSGGVNSSDDPSVKAFMDYAKMTPAQKMRAAILGKMNMTEADLAKMDPKERQKIEDKIKAAIKQEVEYGDKDHKGALVDITA